MAALTAFVARKISNSDQNVIGKTHLSTPGVNKAYTKIQNYYDENSCSMNDGMKTLIAGLEGFHISDGFLSIVEGVERQIREGSRTWDLLT